MVLTAPDEGWFEIGQEEREEPRYYPVQGRLLPSVTTVKGIIGHPYLQQWRGRVGNEQANQVTNDAALYGQAIHDFTAIMDMTGGGLEIIGTPPAEMYTQLSNYIVWRDRSVQEIVEVEKVVYSLAYGYAGKLDRVWVLKGDTLPSVGDIKTGTIRNIDRAQTAAYAQAYTEMTNRSIGRRGLVGVSRKTGKVRFKAHDDPGDFQGFLTLLAAYRWLESVGEV